MKKGAGVAEAEVLEEENLNGTANADDPENLNPEHQPGEGEDTNAGGEGGAVDENGNPIKEEAQPELTPDPRDEKIAKLQEQLDAVNEKLVKAPPAPPPQPVVLSEEQKEKISQQFGGLPFEQVDALTQYIGSIVHKLKEEIRGNLQSETGSFKKDAAIASMAKQKEYADIRSYTKGMDEFLGEYSPEFHSNPKLLRSAFFYAKGLGLKNTVNKIRNSTETNRRIAGPARPGATGGGKGGAETFSYKLTPSERSAYESFGKDEFGSEEEYARSLPRYQKK